MKRQSIGDLHEKAYGQPESLSGSPEKDAKDLDSP